MTESLVLKSPKNDHKKRDEDTTICSYRVYRQEEVRE